MTVPIIYSRAYENWAPLVARIIFGAMFLMSAAFKIPGTDSFHMQVEMSGTVGLPFPLVAVTLAFILEIIAGIGLIIGWHARTMAALLAAFTFLIAIFFFRDLSDQTKFGMFVNCFGLIAGLIYTSVYGAQHAAVAKDPLPKGISRSES